MNEKSPVLLNPKWEAFAQAVASGLSASEAYRKIGGKGKNADVIASRMLVNVGIRDRIAELKKAGADKVVFTIEDALKLAIEIINTPAGEVDRNHRLCQEYSETIGEMSSSKRFKMPDKLAALEKIIKMKGWYAPEKNEHSIAIAFAFISADPTLQDLQIDIRTGAVASSRSLFFKQFTTARLALVFLEFGVPVTPPDYTTTKIDIRPSGRWNSSDIFPAFALSLVAASGGDPAYLLAEIEVSGGDVEYAINALVKAQADPPTATSPALLLMADVKWIASTFKRASNTFNITLAPAVTQ